MGAAGIVSTVITALIFLQEAEPKAPGWTNLILPLGITAMVAFFLLSSRKQRRQQGELLAALREGAEVVTTGGIYGTINVIEGDEVHLEVDDDVVIRVSRSSISRVVTQVVEDTEDESS